VTDQPLEPTSPGMMHHQKADGGQQNLARGLAFHFPEPVCMQDWHHLTEVNQARALTVGIEHWRSHWPRVAGCIVWQLNDCWPVSSWSVIDGDGHRKPAWYALRRAYADRLVTVQPDGDGLVAACINQSAEQWAGALVVSVVDFAGSVRGTTSMPVTVAPRTVLRVPVPADLTIDDPARQVLVARLGARRTLWFAAEDLDLDYAADPLEVDVTSEAGGYAVRVTARFLARDIVVHADRLDPDAVVDDGVVTLLAGESRTLHVVTSSTLDAASLGSGPVLVTVNDSVVATRALSVRVE